MVLFDVFLQEFGNYLPVRSLVPRSYAPAKVRPDGVSDPLLKLFPTPIQVVIHCRHIMNHRFSSHLSSMSCSPQSTQYLTSFSLITMLVGTVVSTRPLTFHPLVDLVTVKTPLRPDLGRRHLSRLHHLVQFAVAELQVPGQFI